MKQTFVICRYDISGGTATLSLRLGEWLVGKGYDVVYICQEFNDVNNVTAMRKKGIRVHRWSTEEVGYNLKDHYGGRTFCFLTYSLNEFLYVESLKRNVAIRANILYVVHHFGLLKGATQNTVMRHLLKQFYRRVVRKMLENQTVVFMDARTVSETTQYYGCDVVGRQAQVIGLPMKVKAFPDEKIMTKQSLDTFNLLTIARAEFPFKGYIIGLIENFRILCNQYSNVSLTIISFGRDELEIYEKISALSNDLQKKVHVVGQTPYEELHKYFDRTHLYLGMGTTVLDAANHGVPSLLVQGYTYECNSSGFFHQQPELLCAYDSLLNSNHFIEKIIGMNEQEYFDLCAREHAALERFYDVRALGDHLIGVSRGGDLESIPFVDLGVHKVLVGLKTFVGRVENQIKLTEGE